MPCAIEFPHDFARSKVLRAMCKPRFPPRCR